MIKRFIRANILYREEMSGHRTLDLSDLIRICETDRERSMMKNTWAYARLELARSWHDLFLACWMLFTPLDKKS